ncbi:MAG: GNAT family N-acetyltransferase [Tissierellia bacterium]|nr:GNAT family N-acetyltransferase [Tissierellia bacterium]
MDPNIERQLIVTIEERMKRSGSFYYKREDSIVYDFDVDENDGHLRGIILGPNTVDGLSIVDGALDIWKKDSRKNWRIRMAMDQKEKYREELYNRGFYIKDENGGPAMERGEKIHRDIKYSVEFPEINDEIIDEVAVVLGLSFELSEKTSKKLIQILHQGELALIRDENTGEVLSSGFLSQDPKTDYWGLYYIGTHPDHRGKGLAKDLVATMTNYALDHHAKKVILQASELGKYVYDALGYCDVGSYITFYWERKSEKC